MGIFRRLAGFLGFSKDEGQEVREEEDNVGEGAQNSNNVPLRKGFSVPVQVAVPRDVPGPILIPCNTGHGGVQVINWRRGKSDKI